MNGMKMSALLRLSEEYVFRGEEDISKKDIKYLNRIKKKRN